MEINLIIDITEFADDKLIPQTTDPARIERSIREAQQFDLRKLLGDALYYDLVANYDPDLSGGPSDAYRKLVEGDEYENSHGHNIIFSGLRMVIKYYAYARHVASQQVNVTTHGVVTKTNPDSTPVDSKTISAEVATARNGAVAYWEEAKCYLNAKKDDFPLWKSTDMRPRSGLNIMAVGGDSSHHRNHRR